MRPHPPHKLLVPRSLCPKARQRAAVPGGCPLGGCPWDVPGLQAGAWPPRPGRPRPSGLKRVQLALSQSPNASLDLCQSQRLARMISAREALLTNSSGHDRTTGGPPLPDPLPPCTPAYPVHPACFLYVPNLAVADASDSLGTSDNSDTFPDTSGTLDNSDTWPPDQTRPTWSRLD